MNLILNQLISLIVLVSLASAIHLKGTFKTNQFFKFISRFGFQPTDLHDEQSTQGYIYGNITLIDKDYFSNYSYQDIPSITLAVIDYNYFIDYYNRRLVRPRSSACSMMFEKIDKMAFFYECNEKGKEDFIRRIPCESGKLCVDEDTAERVIKNYQFTYKIRDYNQARFWFISIVSCTKNSKSQNSNQCKWYDLSDYSYFELNKTSSNVPASYTIEYDIWLVNGHPYSNYKNHFEHQYSYELHDVFEIYLTSFIIYLFIMPFVVYRLVNNFHYLYLQLLVYISIEVTCRFLSLIHNLVYSFNGTGVYVFDLMSNFLEVLASSCLILILISIAKGWTVRSRFLKLTRSFYLLGIFLQIALVTSHMVSLFMIDEVFNTNSYETVAGYVELSVRFVCMIWFVYELKETFSYLQMPSINDPAEFDSDFDDETVYEINGKKYKSLSTEHSNSQQQVVRLDNKNKEDRVRSYQKFYLHYGACSLVWFIYLPVLIFITSFVTELYRLRLVLSIRYFVNFISVVVLFYIMWSPKTPLKLPGNYLLFVLIFLIFLNLFYTF